MSSVVVLDFDGTVTDKDVGDEVCDRFAPSSWRDIDAAWVRNEISLPEAQRRMWELVRCERADAVAYALEIGRLRPGLDGFLDAAARNGFQVWLASGGFDFYIEAILGDRLHRLARTFYNRTRFDAGGLALEFHQGFSCGRCAVCKGRICQLAREQGAIEVIFVGDGASDRCAIGKADRICAVRGGLLAQNLDAERAFYHAFDALDELLPVLG